MTGVVVLIALLLMIILGIVFWRILNQKSPVIPPKKSRPLNLSESKVDSQDAVAAILGLAAVTVAGYVAVKGAQKGLSLLKGIDLSSLDPLFKEALNRFTTDFEAVRNNYARLDKAEELLATGDKISVEQAAMLTSAALEAGLKTLCNRHHIVSDVDTAEGMSDIALTLKNNMVISLFECNQVRKFAAIVRNRVMHGDFDMLRESDVREQIRFTRELFEQHELRQ